MKTIHLDRPYIHISQPIDTVGTGKNKERSIEKASSVCTWEGNKCVWKGGYRIRFRNIKFSYIPFNYHTGESHPERDTFNYPTFDLRVAVKSRSIYSLISPDWGEHGNTPLMILPAGKDQYYGKGKVTRKMSFISSSWDEKRCSPPTVKLTFKLSEAPPLEKSEK